MYVHVLLSNGRDLQLSENCILITDSGFIRASEVVPGTRIAVPIHVGPLLMPASDKAILESVGNEICDLQLRARNLLPFYPAMPYFSAVMRLLGFINGDGNLGHNKYRLNFWNTETGIIDAVEADLASIGFKAKRRVRQRRVKSKPEIHLYCDSKALHALFAQLGCPVGRKRWLVSPMSWLEILPNWAIATFLSSFACAEMVTPWLASNSIPNLAMKQSSGLEEANGIEFIGRLVRRLGFEFRLALSGPIRGERRDMILQILGGETEQLRFLQEVGFCYSPEKRRAAAKVASVVWLHQEFVQRHTNARAIARSRYLAGENRLTALPEIESRFRVSHSFAEHSYYGRGGVPRMRGEERVPSTLGERVWLEVKTTSVSD